METARCVPVASARARIRCAAILATNRRRCSLSAVPAVDLAVSEPARGDRPARHAKLLQERGDRAVLGDIELLVVDEDLRPTMRACDLSIIVVTHESAADIDQCLILGGAL